MHLNDINAAARQHRHDLIAEAAHERLARAARATRPRRRIGRGSRTLAAVASALAAVLGAAEAGLVRSGRALSGLHRSRATYAPARPFDEALARARAELLEAATLAPQLAAG